MSDFPVAPGAQPPHNQAPQQPNNHAHQQVPPSGYPQPGYPQPGYPPQQGQNFYQQPGHPGNGYPQGPPTTPGNGLAIVALVLGIVAIALAWIPFAGLISIPIGLAAVICGGIALARKGAAKVMPAIGGALGLIGIVVAIVVTVIAVIAVGSAVQNSIDRLPSGLPSNLPSELNKEHSYKLLVSSVSEAQLSYSAGGQSASRLAVKGTWQKEITAKSFLSLATISVSTVDLSSSGNKVSCEIFIDGQSVSKKSAADFVTCFGTLK